MCQLSNDAGCLFYGFADILAFFVLGFGIHAPLDKQCFECGEGYKNDCIERKRKTMALLPQGMRTLEELDDKLDGFEIREGMPCVTHRGRSGTCGACSGAGRAGNNVSCSFQAMPGSRQRCPNRLKST